MKFNGNDLITFVGPKVSISKEIPPMMIGRKLTLLEGSRRIYLGSAGIAAQTYTLKLNIHAGSMANAWAVRHKIAAWAYSEDLAPLIPSHEPTIYYNAVLQSISSPTFVWGACVVDVVFLIPTPYAHAVTMLTPSGSGSLTFDNLGSYDPAVRLTAIPDQNIENPTVLVNGLPAFVAVGAVETGVPMIIDFENKTYQVNGLYAMDKINFLTTDWAPGWVSGSNTIALNDCALSAEVVARWL